MIDEASKNTREMSARHPKCVFSYLIDEALQLLLPRVRDHVVLVVGGGRRYRVFDGKLDRVHGGPGSTHAARRHRAS